ncbi:MAG: hypothetical protein DLM70_12830, partial [Chloroflexi bacterium]
MTKHRRSLALAVLVSLGALLSIVAPTPRAVEAAATLQLSPASIPAGTAIRVTGYGFRPGDTALVSVTVSTRAAPRKLEITVGVRPKGSFSAFLGIPENTLPGTYVVSAQDFHGHIATHDLTVLPLVFLRVGTTAGPVGVVAGHSFYLRGTGFLPLENVSVSVSFPLYGGNAMVLNQTERASSEGNLSTLSFAVPPSARRGAATVTATGAGSLRVARARLTVSYQPALRLGAAVIRPGTSVTVLGSAFVPFSHVRVAMTIPLSNGLRETIERDAATGSAGGFTAMLPVPSTVRPGVYTVSATDLRGGFQAFARVRVAVHPSLSIQPGVTQPGQTVLLLGGGFAARVTVSIVARFPLTIGGARVVTTSALTQANGSFATRVT